MRVATTSGGIPRPMRGGIPANRIGATCSTSSRSSGGASRFRTSSTCARRVVRSLESSCSISSTSARSTDPRIVNWPLGRVERQDC